MCIVSVNAASHTLEIRDIGLGDYLQAELKVLASFVSNRDALGRGYSLQFNSPYASDEPHDSFLTRSGMKHRCMLFVRGLAAPQMTLDWLALWQNPTLVPLKKSHPRVLLKLQRPYLQRHLEPEERWEILRQHYSFALATFRAAALMKIFAPPGFLLADVPVPEVGHFGIRLFYDNLFEKEGELSLMLYDEDKKAPLFAMTFCVSSNQPGNREIFVGGLQGCSLSKNRELVVGVTRGMFGLRPKAALLFALKQLAFVWSIPMIRAVCNQNRVLPPNNQPIKANYDQFWIESSGQLDDDGNFSLPTMDSPRASTEIRRNKRAMYRHRYELLARLGEQLRQNIARLSA
jgi:uncharacterized protein VirK/YbjX